MSIPKSITKVSKDGTVTFKSNVDQVNYYINELVLGALRDSGKYIAKMYRIEFYNRYAKHKGKVGKGIGYWARRKEKDLQVGFGKKNIGFWGYILYLKDTHNFMKTTIIDNISTIENIQAQYLSELSKETPDISGIGEGDITDEE